jgi:hypothetical protein
MFWLSRAIGSKDYQKPVLASTSLLYFRVQRSSPHLLFMSTKVLNATRIKTIIGELEEAAKKGGEFRGITAANRLLYVGEYLMVVEWIKGNTQPRFDYRVFYDQSEKEIDRLINESSISGYSPVGLIESVGAANIIVLSRIASTTPVSSSLEFKLLSTRKSSTFEKELNQAAQEGYRLEFAAPLHMALMSRQKNRQVQESYEYKLGVGKNVNDVQSRISELATQGFICRGFTSTVEPIMERNTKSTSQESLFEYKLIHSKSTDEMQNVIKALADTSYSILDFYSGAVNVYLFQRPVKK